MAQWIIVHLESSVEEPWLQLSKSGHCSKDAHWHGTNQKQPLMTFSNILSHDQQVTIQISLWCWFWILKSDFNDQNP